MYGNVIDNYIFKTNCVHVKMQLTVLKQMGKLLKNDKDHR